jgi:hypothetical protein
VRNRAIVHLRGSIFFQEGEVVRLLCFGKTTSIFKGLGKMETIESGRRFVRSCGWSG